MSGVISVMKDNISRVMERGEKLEDLEEKSGTVVVGGSCFLNAWVYTRLGFMMGSHKSGSQTLDV